MANKDFRRLFALLPSFLTVINRNNRLIWQNGKNHTLALQPSITTFKVEVKVSQSYTNETGGKVGGDVPCLSQVLSLFLSPVERNAVEEDGVCN